MGPQTWRDGAEVGAGEEFEGEERAPSKDPQVGSVTAGKSKMRSDHMSSCGRPRRLKPRSSSDRGVEATVVKEGGARAARSV